VVAAEAHVQVDGVALVPATVLTLPTLVESRSNLLLCGGSFSHGRSTAQCGRY
jgi:hypothetical protein